MNGNNNQQAYDRGVSVFSPEGRIYQVEYAREAVKRGAPGVGIRAEDGVVMAAKTVPQSSLVVDGSIEKIHKVEDGIGAVSVGYVPDGRRLTDDLRVMTQQEQLRYGEEARVATITKRIADHIQESTQVGGRRPYGASLIIGGVDEEAGPKLYDVEPGGTPTEWAAVAQGSNRAGLLDYFESTYTDGVSVEDALVLAVNALDEHANGVTPESLDVGVVTEDESFYQMTEDELEEYCE